MPKESGYVNDFKGHSKTFQLRAALGCSTGVLRKSRAAGRELTVVVTGQALEAALMG